MGLKINQQIDRGSRKGLVVGFDEVCLWGISYAATPQLLTRLVTSVLACFWGL